jgi:DNA-binding transcriptional ArsR family regulator
MTKSSALNSVALILTALGNLHRLQILEALKDGELPVREITRRVGLQQAATSQHLSKLRAAGLVLPRKQSQSIFYSVSSPQVVEVIKNAESLVLILRATLLPGQESRDT